jgi:putative ABC transport system substrate-binding protein
MRRREFMSLLGGAATAWPLAARAQQTHPGARIGLLYPGLAATAVTRVAALRDGLRAAGYGEADRIEVLVRSSEGDPAQLAPLAADLVERKVDVLVPASPPAVRAAKSATTVIPIVADDLESDPVASGFISSLAHPGGNVTGVFSDFPEFGMKWLELLKEGIPALSNVVVFWDPSTGPVQVDAVKAASRLLNVQQQVVEVRAMTGLERAFDAAAEQRPDAAVILSSPVFGTNPKLVAELAFARHIPTATLFDDIARAGGFLAYGPNLNGTFRQVGTMVGKILQGTRLADLPVERPTKFDTVVNLKTAKALGLSLPTSLLLRADEVIE